jgi:hypothetical protein
MGTNRKRETLLTRAMLLAERRPVTGLDGFLADDRDRAF